MTEIGVAGQNPWERLGQSPEVYNLPPLNINVGGLNSGYYTDLYYEMSLNYTNTFGKHTVSGMALMNRQQQNREQISLTIMKRLLAGQPMIIPINIYWK